MGKIDYGNQSKWVQEYGQRQSPIILDPDRSQKMAKIIINYDEPATGIKLIDKQNNLGIESIGSVNVDGRNFSLNEVHFHLNAEHQLRYEKAPRAFEAHFVHQGLLGEKMVIGVTFKVGEPNETFEKLLKGMEEKFALTGQVDLSNLIPSESDFYWYSGSLTTPPLTEGVEWIVYDQSLTITNEQLERYQRFYPEKNARQIQPTNGRKVYLM